MAVLFVNGDASYSKGELHHPVTNAIHDINVVSLLQSQLYEKLPQIPSVDFYCLQ